jgi:hypothetical protein
MSFDVTQVAPPAVDAWARGFVERWSRNDGALAGDFSRFLDVHQVPPDSHEAVRERAQELLLGLPFRAGPGAPNPCTETSPR